MRIHNCGTHTNTHTHMYVFTDIFKTAMNSHAIVSYDYCVDEKDGKPKNTSADEAGVCSISISIDVV